MNPDSPFSNLLDPKTTGNLPIIGQLGKVFGAVLIVSLQCNCDAKNTPAQLVAGQVFECPTCKKKMSVQAKVEMALVAVV